MKKMINIGPELRSEMEFRLETIQDSIESDGIEGGYDKDDLFVLEDDRVELKWASYDMVLMTSASIESEGVKNYPKLWNEIKKFYIDVGTAIPFDREAYNRGEIICTGGLKRLIMFKHKGIEYTFGEHPECSLVG
tara:strand:+ start:237 stop:641 length:405 start_codon:yes stop_codon:yes gene_type:complete